MIFELNIGCPECGLSRVLTTSNLNKIRFKCFFCGFSTTRKLKDRYGNYNFKINNRIGDKNEN